LGIDFARNRTTKRRGISAESGDGGYISPQRPAVGKNTGQPNDGKTDVTHAETRPSQLTRTVSLVDPAIARIPVSRRRRFRESVKTNRTADEIRPSVFCIRPGDGGEWWRRLLGDRAAATTKSNIRLRIKYVYYAGAFSRRVLQV